MENTTSELLRRHLSAVAETRKAFIECETNEKLRRAIKSKLRPTTSMIYMNSGMKYTIKETTQISGRAQELSQEKRINK